MKQRFFTAIIVVAALLFGLAHAANAQTKGQPWNERWDSCMRGAPTVYDFPIASPANFLPYKPGGPYAYLEHVVMDDHRYVPMPLRIYQNCPVQIDSAFIVPAGTKRQVVFKNMPKDDQGQHYLINRLTGRVFPEFDPIDLPDADEPTPFPMLFEHYALTPGDPVYKDGYRGEIIAETKINGATVKYDTIRYQYFERPTATLNFEAPGPMVAGKFELTFHGELIQPENYVGYDPKGRSMGLIHPSSPYRIMSEEDARDLSRFNAYTTGAYYSLDEGATWIPVPTKTIKLTQSQIDELPDELNIWVRLPYGCSAFIPLTPGGDSLRRPRKRLPDIIPSITRQVILQNETGDLSPTLVEPLRQIYDVPTGRDFVFTVHPTGGNVPTLTTSRDGHISDAVGVITEVLPDGAYRFTVRRVQENLTVTLKYTVGTDEVDGTRVWGEEGVLCIMSAAASPATVYNALGHLMSRLTLSAGETRRLPLASGVYLVKLGNGRAYKAAVR